MTLLLHNSLWLFKWNIRRSQDRSCWFCFALKEHLSYYRTNQSSHGEETDNIIVIYILILRFLFCVYHLWVVFPRSPNSMERFAFPFHIWNFMYVRTSTYSLNIYNIYSILICCVESREVCLGFFHLASLSVLEQKRLREQGKLSLLQHRILWVRGRRRKRSIFKRLILQSFASLGTCISQQKQTPPWGWPGNRSWEPALNPALKDFFFLHLLTQRQLKE